MTQKTTREDHAKTRGPVQDNTGRHGNRAKTTQDEMQGDLKRHGPTHDDNTQSYIRYITSRDEARQRKGDDAT